MAVKTLDKKIVCVKCGFRPTYQAEWKLEYKDKCNSYGYNSCGWDDEVDEHLHQECPECGYTFPVACEDHATATPDKWTTGHVATTPVTTVPATTRPATVTPLATRTAVTPVFQSTKPAKCGQCPVDAKATSEG